MSFKTIVFTSNFYPCRTQPNPAEDAALWKSNLNKLDQKRASAKQCLQSTAKYNAASEHRTQKILHRLMKQQSILASRHLRPAKYANLIFFLTSILVHLRNLVHCGNSTAPKKGQLKCGAASIKRLSV